MKLLFLIGVLAMTTPCLAQEVNQSINSIYTEATAPLNLIYERQIFTISNTSVAAHTGLGHGITTNSRGQKSWGIPIGINFIVGKRKSHFEYALAYWRINKYGSNSVLSNKAENIYRACVGYRYQNLNNRGLVFRIGLSLNYSNTLDYDYWDSETYGLPYLSLGYGF